MISLLNLMPLFFIRQFWVGGALKSLPLPISNLKKFNFAVTYIFRLLKQKSKNINLDFLTELIILSLYKRGQVYVNKLEAHRKSSENRHLLRLLK
jgi:ribosomal protein S7